jgi:hypothetical protein
MEVKRTGRGDRIPTICSAVSYPYDVEITKLKVERGNSQSLASEYCELAKTITMKR